MASCRGRDGCCDNVEVDGQYYFVKFATTELFDGESRCKNGLETEEKILDALRGVLGEHLKFTTILPEKLDDETRATIVNKAQCQNDIHKDCVAIYRSAKTVVDFSDQNINDEDRQEMHTVLLNVLTTMNNNGWMHNDLKLENLVKFTHANGKVEYLVSDFGAATHKGTCVDDCDREYIEKLNNDISRGVDEEYKLCLAACLPSHETTTEESFDIQKPLKRPRLSGGSSRKFIGAFIGLGITAACAAIGAIFE